ncbi:hypothetical protein RJ640_015884 [Escallonia rubra]|uniref:Pentatricopeptide repeat-containing protein n=1 Tax=Escallonia rubra TaxID=112253 RepID=A0AA88QUW4_9ASTE|nr:hypothetical protein RJ640_015884 [Escallonia rubra]
MLHNLVALHHQHNACVKQVSSLFPLFPINRHFFTTSLEEHQPTLPSPSTHKTNDLYLNAPSVNFHGIAESVILKSSHLWDKKGQNFCNPSLKDHLLHLSSIPPKHIRRFWRISELKPEHVLEILLGFDFDTAKFEIEAKKVEPLWGIFKWASEQSRDFRHLPQSCKVMASILVRAGLFRDVEFLLSKMGSEEILLDSHEIFSELIEGYVATIDLKGAVSTYDRMRGLGLVPSLPSYRALLNYLVQVSDTHLVYRVFVDMLDMGLGVSVAEKSACDSVIQLLCRDGKVQEARNLVKKVITFGMEPNKLVLDAIAIGYCEKKDYDDLLSFFAEVNRAPDDVVGNKIIFSLCRNFGVERAIWFLQELELLGYSPDEITFGILIGCSCRERKLKNAFSRLSKVFSRCLKPLIYSYNALIGGVFQEGMWTHAREVLHEIYDRGVTPDMSTFRVLLAGYCKARQFDEVKSIVVYHEY